MFIGNIYFQNSTIVPKRKKSYHPNYFYILRCHKGKKRFLKVGTTSQTLHQRFKNYPYIIDEIYCIIECFHGIELALEKSCQQEWKKLKGLNYTPKDRFTYFAINKEQIKKLISQQIKIFTR